ncbi:MAG: methyltransferase domain-containing protein [bacterium]|nr:methyltransferase domain-containing protein [bacterium]
MRNDAAQVALLHCRRCGGAMRLHEITEQSSDEHIVTGSLVCQRCDEMYPIIRGVPRFSAQLPAFGAAGTIGGFGYQWRVFNPPLKDSRCASAEIFLDFIKPVSSGFFVGKVVLDAGCGQGRFTRWAHDFGARIVVGVDLSDSVDVAFANTRHLPNVLIVQADILSLPFSECFDYIFSIGVLHHTGDTGRAFCALAGHLRAGGAMSTWVYGKEGNGWVIHFLNPLRQNITSRLPRGVLRMLSGVAAVPLYMITKGIYGPVGTRRWMSSLRKILFYFDYLHFFSQFGFREQWLIIFDHLVPAIADYVPYQVFAQWHAACDLQEVTITSRHGNSWRGFGKKP